MTDEELLQELHEERNRPGPPNLPRMRELVDQLVQRGVYLEKSLSGNTALQMVEGWGAYWHVWREPFECPHCKRDIRDHKSGPPFKLEVGIYDRDLDRTTHFLCPYCKGVV